MKENDKPELIEAAGGLVWRENEGRREILVIHRSRYGDWALPKGKLKKGESLEETALREVAEESGYRVGLLGFAGHVFYFVGESPKIVLFWNMQAEAEIPAEERASDSPDEGDEVRWLPVPEALVLISYEAERDLLKRAAQHSAHGNSIEPALHREKLPVPAAGKEKITMDKLPEPVTMVRPGPLAFRPEPLVPPSKWYNRLISGPHMERLRTSLEIYYHEMEQLEAMVNEEAHTGYHSYFQAAASLLERAKEAVLRGDVEYGWGAFNAAQRLETLLYFKMSCDGRNGPLQEYARAMYLSRAEGIIVEGGDKLSGWRLKRMQGLLCGERDRLKDGLQVSEVLQAQRVMSEHFENTYLRLEIIIRQIRFLEIVAAAALVIWLLLLQFTDLFAADSLTSPLSLSAVALIFGTLGACISGILRLEKRSLNRRIPDQLESRAFMLARPLLGAVSALGVIFFILAGIVDLGRDTAGLYMAAAFAAGFTERLLKFGVERVGGGEEEEKRG